MKIVHKNSREEFDARWSHDYKHNSVYGVLVVTYNKSVLFFRDNNVFDYEDMTDDFEFID